MSRSERFKDEVNEAFQNEKLLLLVVVEHNPQKTLGISHQFAFKMYHMNNLMWSFPNVTFNSQFACVGVRTCSIGLKITMIIAKVLVRSTNKRRRVTLILDNTTGKLINSENMVKTLPMSTGMYEEMDSSFLLSPSQFPLEDSILCWVPSLLTSPIQYWKSQRSGGETFVGVVDGFMARSQRYKCASCNQHALFGIMNDHNIHIYKYIVTSHSYGFHITNTEQNIIDFDMNETILAYQKRLPNGVRKICILKTSSLENHNSVSLDLVDFYKILNVNLGTDNYLLMYLTNTFVAIVVRKPTNQEDLLIYTNFDHPAHTIKNVAQRNFALFDHHYIVQTNDGWEYNAFDFPNSILQTEIQKVLKNKRWRSEDTLHQLLLLN